jgi:putative membrane protein
MITRVKKRYLPALASLALLFGGTAMFAQSQTTKKPEPAPKAATSKITDTEFAQKAAEANMAEVKLGQLAEQKGTTDTVKDFGKRMVTDHTTAEENLKSAALKDKITLPSALDSKDQAVYDSLSKLSGEAFDRAYARDMVRDHRIDVAEFRHEGNDGKSVAIKGFASQTLPTLEDHLKLAREMNRDVSAKNISHTKSTSHTGA